MLLKLRSLPHNLKARSSGHSGVKNMPNRTHLAIAAIALTLSACAQPKEDPKVAELQKQLAATQQELAATKDAQAGAVPGQAAAAQPATAGAAADAARPAQPTTAAPLDQADRDRASTEKKFADQQAALAAQKTAINRTAEENARLRGQVESLKPREFTLPAGTVIPVRTTAEISTSKVKNGSVFEALLEKDLVVDGTVLAKEGTMVHCIVVESDPGGRVKGVASLSVAAKSIAGVGGNTLTVKTHSYSVDANNTKKKDTVRTGIATGVGAVIGGIAGGGKGAAIGAGVGAGAGVGTAMATRGDAAVIPTETLIEFTLSAPATVVIRK
jgi:hypothetical protein